jgi:thiosulfate/3-mercaptopyruvate sulfurtransferase
MSGLVSRAWLGERLGAVYLIDLRLAADGGKAGYLEGHIPGAVFSDYAGDGWRQRVGNVPGLLPDAAHRAALFAKLGITPETEVVLIPVGSGANDFAASARAYWTLKLSGHAKVSILDGGTRGWRAAGLPLETAETAANPAPPYPIRDDASLRKQAEAVGLHLSRGDASLLDARSPSYFEGREKASEAKSAGHIPGALSLDYVRAFDPSTGALRPLDALAELFAPALGKPVVSYCNTGHTAALNWFVLREVLGQPDVALYDGSMTDWTQDETRPISTGP